MLTKTAVCRKLRILVFIGLLLGASGLGQPASAQDDKKPASPKKGDQKQDDKKDNKADKHELDGKHYGLTTKITAWNPDQNVGIIKSKKLVFAFKIDDEKSKIRVDTLVNYQI